MSVVPFLERKERERELCYNVDTENSQVSSGVCEMQRHWMVVCLVFIPLLVVCV